MRRWREIEENSFDRMIDLSDGDRIYQSDWSTQRIGQAFCEVIGVLRPDPLLKFSKWIQPGRSSTLHYCG